MRVSDRRSHGGKEWLSARLPANAAVVAALIAFTPAAHGAEPSVRCEPAARGADEIRLEAALRQGGCSLGSIIVVGSENNTNCRALESALAELRAARAGAADCTDRPSLSHSQFRAPHATSHSQFRQRVVFGSVTELRLGGMTQDVVEPEETDALERRASIDTERGPHERPPAPSPSEPVIERELIDLETRLAERNVRVVGPTFLPDRSEALDLRSPGRNSVR